MSAKAAPGLFVSDIDGTLVTPDKTLTAAAREAVAELKAAGVPFTVISSRPPRGMAAIIAALDLTLPAAAFNGGTIFAPGGQVVEARRLSGEAIRIALATITAAGVSAWAFADDLWRVTDPKGPKIERERRTVGFEPTVVTDFEGLSDRVDKIVAVCDDPARLDAVEADLRAALAGAANVERSQAYYVDVTHPLANKGEGVRRLAALTGADLAETVVIGDMTNDVAMFRVAGFSIAMGQAPAAVKAAAQAVTGPNTADGFAAAVRQLAAPRFAAPHPAATSA